MKIDLIIPYSQHEQAKSRGAKWDAARKTWYVEDVEDSRMFIQWAPEKFTSKTKSQPLKHPIFEVVQPRTPTKKVKQQIIKLRNEVNRIETKRINDANKANRKKSGL